MNVCVCVCALFLNCKLDRMGKLIKWVGFFAIDSVSVMNNLSFAVATINARMSNLFE